MVWRFLKKLGIKPPYDPAIPLLGIYPEETRVEKNTSELLSEVDEPRAHYRELNKSEREKQISYINTYIWNLEKWY